MLTAMYSLIPYHTASLSISQLLLNTATFSPFIYILVITSNEKLFGIFRNALLYS